MAFTGKKIKGSRVLTAETVENRGKFYKIMNNIKELNEEKYQQLKEQMFWSMFEYLSHSAQREFIDWSKNIEWQTLINKEVM